MTHRLPK